MRIARLFAVVGATALAVWSIQSPVESAPPAAGAAGKFSPVAPAGLLIEKARELHKKAAIEVDDDPKYAEKLSLLAAEYLHVQEFRDNPALVDFAKKQVGLLVAAANAAANEEKDEAAAKLAAVGKNWALYDKNSKVWGSAKAKAGDHKRVSPTRLDVVMPAQKLTNEKLEAAVRAGNISKITNDILLLAEHGNMMLGDRPAPKWKEFASGLRDGALHLIKVGEAGGVTTLKPALLEVQKNCNSCHGDFKKQ